MDSEASRIKAPHMVSIALGALVVGYLWGYGVGEREGLDSSVEDLVQAGKVAAFEPEPDVPDIVRKHEGGTAYYGGNGG